MEAVELPRYAGGHCDAASALALATYAHRYLTDAPPPRFTDPIPVDVARDSPIARQVDGVTRHGDVDGAGRQSLSPPPGWDDDQESILRRRF
jgi:hypothetical protein